MNYYSFFSPKLKMWYIESYEEKNIEEITENAVKSKDFETGEIKLNPRWKYDYAKTSQDLIKKIKCN